MSLLALLHRWTVGIAGLLLALIGPSGMVLMWEESWIGRSGADDPPIAKPAAIGNAVAAVRCENLSTDRRNQKRPSGADPPA